MPQPTTCLRAALLAWIAFCGLPVRAQMLPVPDTSSNDSPPINLSLPIYNAVSAGTSAPLSLPGGTGSVDGTPVAEGGRALPEGASSSLELPAAPGGAPGAASGVIRPPVTRVKDLPAPRSREGYRMRPLRAVAFGLTASTLGGGAEMAVPLARSLNLRVGASYIRYDVPFSINGIDYDPGVKFTAGRSTIDWFPHHGGFHISAGALFFRNTIAGRASVVEGQTFKLSDTTYVNSVDDPIHGSASIVYHRTLAPMVLLGFGNLLPRSGRHVSVPFEIGGAYLQPPDMNLSLAGTACTNQGCFNAATDPTLRENLAKENERFTSDLRWLQVYPIVSLGLACRF